MKYVIQYSVSEPTFHDIIDCEQVVEADSLPKAIHEVIELSERMHQKMLGITNYYWLED